MKFLRLEALFFLLLTAPAAVAQSNLPQCLPETPQAHWDNCSGVLTFRDGSKYVGGFVGGKMSGQGTLAWANGDKYVGEFRNDKMDGQGTMSWANGDRYVGRFKADQSTAASGNSCAQFTDQWERNTCDAYRLFHEDGPKEVFRRRAKKDQGQCDYLRGVWQSCADRNGASQCNVEEKRIFESEAC